MTQQTQKADHPRAVGVLFKMSRQDREVLKQRARDAGCETVQQYLEYVALGRWASPRPAGRPVEKPSQELPLSA